MLTKARNLLEQTRLQKHTNMPYTDALPPPGRSKRGRPISFSSGSPLSRSMDDESTSATGHNKANENEFPTTRTKTTMRTHSPQHRFSTNDLSSKKPQHDGTICSPNGGSPHNNVHSPSSPPQPTSTGSQPGRASGQSTPPPTIAPLTPPDGVKIRRLRLSQISLFASGRGSAAPVPTRIGEHRLDAANANAQGQTKISDEPRTPQPTRSQPLDHPVSPSTYRYAMSDQNSPVHRPPVVTTNPALSNYIANEQAELDQAQRELDEEAAQLEQRLRMQMQHAPGTATEEKLLRRWFVLVNKKDALIRRGMQLSIMEKEDDLKKKTEMLQEELRQILSIEDYMKTDSDRRREELLLHDLVQLVNERDDMIQQLDLHEKILADELNLERNASKLPPFETGRSEKACVIQ
ncbi:unnamed protein product [Calicophoron daubneyi]|uniref:BMERB domain-containing protein n=1 Tax=Calicophoron daubneyi TaxID=300641 RepID=A0AAV2T7U1_CALDB